jgi:hypothetical protein
LNSSKISKLDKIEVVPVAKSGKGKRDCVSTFLENIRTCNVGGLIGTNASTFILTSSYYDTTTSGKSDNDGRGVPKTTSQMKMQSTFQPGTNNWDFNNIWGIQDTVSYPYLRWQNL